MKVYERASAPTSGGAPSCPLWGDGPGCLSYIQEARYPRRLSTQDTVSDAFAYPGRKWPLAGNHRWPRGLTARKVAVRRHLVRACVCKGRIPQGERRTQR